MPTLVIHGENDKMIGISGGRATAAAIPSAELATFEGMGHGLPKQLWPEFAIRIADLIHRVESSRWISAYDQFLSNINTERFEFSL